MQAGTTNQYGVSLLGWFPDYPDADDYTGPVLPLQRRCSSTTTATCK